MHDDAARSCQLLLLHNVAARISPDEHINVVIIAVVAACCCVLLHGGGAAVGDAAVAAATDVAAGDHLYGMKVIEG